MEAAVRASRGVDFWEGMALEWGFGVRAFEEG